MKLPIRSRDRRAAVHLLNRAGFGPRPGQVSAVLAGGIEAYLEEQLQPGPDPAVEKGLARFPVLGYSIAQALDAYHGRNPATSMAEISEHFQTIKLIRAVRSTKQLQEVLTDFWFNHFNVNLQSNFVRQALPSYERDAIRPHVLGKFRDLLGATARHPAMLFYLDNYISKKDEVVDGKLVRGLNENYGRELLELHTVGVTAGYTQEHVVDAARCFTGWTIDDIKTTGRFEFRDKDHDAGAKRVFGLDLAAGGGIEDGEKVLDYLALHPITAHFVSRKLACRFVSDDPSESLVERCAQTFNATGGDIREVLTTLFTSAEFWSEAADKKLKTPFEYVASLLRAVDARVESMEAGLALHLDRLGMRPYFCTPPTGYSDRGTDWLDPSYLHRLNFALALARGTVQGVEVGLKELVRAGGAVPADPLSVVSFLNQEIFGGGLSAKTRAAASGVARDGGATLLAKTVGLVLASPEMQAR